MTGALPGGGREPLSADRLKAWLPATLDGMKRESFDVQGGIEAAGVIAVVVEAEHELPFQPGPDHFGVDLLGEFDVSGGAGLAERGWP